VEGLVLGRLLDSAFDAIVLTDDTDVIVAMNAAAERLLGVARADALGRKLATLLVTEVSLSELAGRRLELEAEREDRARIPIELSVSRVDTPPGPLFAVWIRDLRERRGVEDALKNSEAQLRQALKMEAVGRLAGGVAHDFNNVLTAIFGYVDLLLDSMDETDRRRADAEEIKRAAGRAAALTRQLLAFSRKQILQPRRVNLNEIVGNIHGLISKLVGSDVEVRVSAEECLADVIADPGQIEQVLMNLAANARDAMPLGGGLTITTSNEIVGPDDAASLAGLPPGQFVRLTVTDTGDGIAASARPHIFEPFFTTKAQGKGTGLGLATVYGIVKQSGGWIYLDETPQTGASFSLYLPKAE
jgi:two-component system, cell cycle sensor histidine kinase and response regulator CckA